MNIYFGLVIIGLVLLALHIRDHINLREFRNSFRNRNQDHVQFLQRGGR